MLCDGLESLLLFSLPASYVTISNSRTPTLAGLVLKPDVTGITAVNRMQATAGISGLIAAYSIP